MPKVLITDDVHDVLLTGLTELGFDCFYKPDISLGETRKIIVDYAGVVINSKIKADANFIARAKHLKFIARLGSGLDIIDLPAAAQSAITILSAPEGNCNAVSEHAMGMLLSLLNHLHIADREVRQLIWRREKNRGVELEGKTVGIIGYGHTGPAFAEKLKGFSVEVLVHDPFLHDAQRKQYVGTTFVELSMLQARADVISLHVSLNETSQYLLNQAFIDQCAKPFVLINTSRGKVVQLNDLLAGLESEKVLGAALDVFENEKPTTYTDKEKDLYSRLFQLENVILTPHVAGWTFESKRKIAQVLLEKIEQTISRN